MRLGKIVAIVGFTISSVFMTNALKAETLLERGTYLAKGVVACGNCHTPKGPKGNIADMEFAGGFKIDEKPLYCLYEQYHT